MTIHFHWDESDFVVAQVTWLRHHPWPIIRGFWYPIVILLIAVAIVAVHPDAWMRSAIVTLFALATIGLGVLMTRWRWHRQFKRTPLWRDDVTATIDQEGIHLRGQSFEARHFWGEFSEIYEAPRVFVFGKANNTFVFVPKSQMSLSESHELRNTITSYARVKPVLASEIV